MLLVRHSYGRSDLWMLPGGGIGRREAPAAAARREVWEETGCACEDLALVDTFRNDAEGRRDTVHLFTATTRDRPVPDGREVIEARFFPLDALPVATSAATLRRVAELNGESLARRW